MSRLATSTTTTMTEVTMMTAFNVPMEAIVLEKAAVKAVVEM